VLYRYLVKINNKDYIKIKLFLYHKNKEKVFENVNHQNLNRQKLNDKL